MTRTALVLAASLGFLTSAQAADKPKEGPVALERKLHGAWKGPACGGDWAFSSEGTFAVEHYSPGNNKLAGSWAVRWNALPPTLLLTFQTSDDPDRFKVDETWEGLEDEARGDRGTREYG